jgi:hypothetical protein
VELVQLYQTTISARTQGYAFRFLTVPSKSLTGAIRHNDPPAQSVLTEALGIADLQPVRPSRLSYAIAGMLRVDEHPEEVEEAQARTLSDRILQQTAAPEKMILPSADMLEFAEQLAFTRVIPFEESPLALVSLAEKAASIAKDPIPLGAFIGVLAGGMTPILLITVPAGIILCGAAAAFARAIDGQMPNILQRLCGVSPIRTQNGDTPYGRSRDAATNDSDDGPPKARRRGRQQ